jgi:putative intracellular protease/amidase
MPLNSRGVKLRLEGQAREDADDIQESFAVVDGRLIAGRNPASSTAAAQELVKLLG